MSPILVWVEGHRFGPIDMGMDADHRFWRVADVDIAADGSCTITPLAGRARTREFDHR